MSDEVVLMSDFVRFLPPDKVILEILETVKADARAGGAHRAN